MPGAHVTLHVLDGADRGRTFGSLHAPVTIGREEGNSVQLNDERVSRFHLKIQEDEKRLVLTDLESTNGTRVNGEDTRLHILRFGDMISIGRSVLVFGSHEQIAERLIALRKSRGEAANEASNGGGSHDYALNLSEAAQDQELLRWHTPPEIPERLSPGQAAQLHELLSYLHLRMRHLLASVAPTEDERVTLDLCEWQNLVDLQFKLAQYIRQVGHPGDSR